MELLLYILIALVIINIIIAFAFRQRTESGSTLPLQKFDTLEHALGRIEASLREDFKTNREENQNIARDNRMELARNLKDFKVEMWKVLQDITGQSKTGMDQVNKTLDTKITSLINKVEEHNKLNREAQAASLNDFKFDQRNKIEELKKDQKENAASFNELQREKFSQLEEKQNKMADLTEKKLEEMRATVEEKLQKTLHERIGQSFDIVGKQLESVQKGLGEMQTLAQDVGGLKRVLSNVKMRGGIGEVQLAMLLEQVLAPEQYAANVKTKTGSSDLVEFAIKLPGRDDNNSIVWLPVDAKFPKDVYDQLQLAYDSGDLTLIEQAQKNLDSTVKKMARDIRDKYIDPPNTTDFGIMFLPFEGIYAEIVRKASLLDELQRVYKIIVTGPTTLAAILNSLQMGFRTLAIQKRSSEVWKVLGAVKQEFENFGGMLEKAQRNLHNASNQIDEVMGKRTRAIQRRLKDVEALTTAETQLILPDIADGIILEEGEV